MGESRENFSLRVGNTYRREHDTICDDSDETGGVCMTVQLDSPGIASVGEASSAEAELGELFEQIKELDAQLLAVIKRRSELVQRAGASAKGTDASREAQAEEMAVLGRFAELGTDGSTLAMTLLRLGRTRKA
ncbi:hypothetical protein RDE2_16460 [Rhodococcus sp. RDE2]|nr:hypothetical protein RDE2_16460 [Rhodococcus sp. RDE2]